MTNIYNLTVCATHVQEICLSYLPPLCVFHSWIITFMNHSWHVKRGVVRKESKCGRYIPIALICLKASSTVVLVAYIIGIHCIWNCSPRYSNEGRVTNITFPTGEVSGFHSNLERWSRVEVEASTRENFVTSTNLSAGDTIYTFRQGKMLCWHVGKEELNLIISVARAHSNAFISCEGGAIALPACIDVYPASSPSDLNFSGWTNGISPGQARHTGLCFPFFISTAQLHS